ncbi:MAG TPA: hypothetical protein PK683_14475 [Leptospiraceae bacterium]|nr:hypothetical protein [Leptospiraceae bacterium]
MQLKEYFKLDWKRPADTEETVSNRQRRESLEKNLDGCFSRLEAAEICSSNDKIPEALILLRSLKIQALNAVLSFFHQTEINDEKDYTQALSKIPDSELFSIFEKIGAVSLYEENSETEEKAEEILSDSLYRIRKRIFAHYEQELKDPIRNFRKRVLFQSVLSSVIIIVLAVSALREIKRKSPLKEDSAQISLSDKREGTPVVSDIPGRKAAFRPGSWNTLKFSLEKPETVGSLRLDPLKQKDARIQIREISFFSKDGKNLFTKNLTVDASKIQSESGNIILVGNISLGRLLQGQPIELVTTGENPSLLFKLEEIKNVSEIRVQMRAVRKSAQFKN